MVAILDRRGVNPGLHALTILGQAPPLLFLLVDRLPGDCCDEKAVIAIDALCKLFRYEHVAQKFLFRLDRIGFYALIAHRHRHFNVLLPADARRPQLGKNNRQQRYRQDQHRPGNQRAFFPRIHFLHVIHPFSNLTPIVQFRP